MSRCDMCGGVGSFHSLSGKQSCHGCGGTGLMEQPQEKCGACEGVGYQKQVERVEWHGGSVYEVTGHGLEMCTSCDGEGWRTKEERLAKESKEGDE